MSRMLRSRQCGPGGLRCHCCSHESLGITQGIARAYEKREWQRDEAIADLDLANGNYRDFTNVADAIDWLRD